MFRAAQSSLGARANFSRHMCASSGPPIRAIGRYERHGWGSGGALAIRFNSTAAPTKSFSNFKRVTEYALGVAAGLGVGYYLFAPKLPSAEDLKGVHISPVPLPGRKEEAPVYRIVLTGGPCGGKSSALSHLTENFAAKGIRVYAVPEIPTLLFTAGCKPITELSPVELMQFEKSILTLQMALEDEFVEIARSQNEPSVIVCDRGALDISAYLPKDTWYALVDDIGVPADKLVNRYNAVIHLVTAADGAEKFYTTGNNAARTEGLELARKLDKDVLRAWAGHRHRFIADNSTGFKPKLEKCQAFLDDLFLLNEGADEASKE